MAFKIKTNVDQQAERLGKMSGNFAGLLSEKRLSALAKTFIPIFADGTPKKTGAAAESIEVSDRNVGNRVSIRMTWGVDYIADVNERTGFADGQFKSVKNRLDHQAKFEIGAAFAEAGKKNKLKVKR